MIPDWFLAEIILGEAEPISPNTADEVEALLEEAGFSAEPL